MFIRGVGSLTESASSPLILVDGIERSFYQMDPNEIESVTVLKDASATAVFGVRGANGVILVTTRSLVRKGKAENFRKFFSWYPDAHPYAFGNGRQLYVCYFKKRDYNK